MVTAIDSLSSQINCIFGVTTSAERKDVVRFLTLFFRKLHQQFEYCNRNHDELFAHVDCVLGRDCIEYLAAILGCQQNFDRSPSFKKSRLRRSIDDISTRFAYVDLVKEPWLLQYFLHALYDEIQYPQRKLPSELVHAVFWALGDEAAFHLSSLFPGRDFQTAFDELDFLEDRAADFICMVEEWAINKANNPAIQYGKA